MIMTRFEAIPITVAFIICHFDISEVKYGRSIIGPDYERLGVLKVSSVIWVGSGQSGYTL